MYFISFFSCTLLYSRDLIAAAIKYFELQSPDDVPKQNLPPPQNANAKVKKEWVYQSAMAILDSYVMADIGKVHSKVEGKILKKEICIQIMHKSSIIM